MSLYLTSTTVTLLIIFCIIAISIYLQRKDMLVNFIYDMVNEAEESFESKEGEEKFNFVYNKAIEMLPLPFWLEWILKSKYCEKMISKFITKTIEEAVLILKKMKK